MPNARTLMIQGTASGVGKSILAAALLRIFRDMGLRAAPFKAQNMSNNSFIAVEGGEIARAQAMQAECAGVKPSIHMNPVLLKPHSDLGSQVILRGRPVRHMKVREYRSFLAGAFPKVKESLSLLRRRFDVVVLEGAGSPAEINLGDSDFVNMKMARVAGAPVLLVGDIDRGGVFASLYGTYALLRREDRKRLAGFLINKFRGDASLLESGVEFLEKRTGIPVLGVIPYMEDLLLDEEDSLQLPRHYSNGHMDVAVFQFPRISNFTDFKPLAMEPGVKVRYFRRREEFGDPDLVILPGTKSTAGDLAFLRKQGLEAVIREYARRGGALLGVCGGFQMLGEWIEDENRVESRQKKVRGLGLLPLKTHFSGDKVTREVQTFAELSSNGRVTNEKVKGYEIHMGRSVALKGMAGKGALWSKGSIYGTYLHGLFDNDSFRRKFLRGLSDEAWARPRSGRGNKKVSQSAGSFRAVKEKSYAYLARTVRKSIDLKHVLSLLRCSE